MGKSTRGDDWSFSFWLKLYYVNVETTGFSSDFVASTFFKALSVELPLTGFGMLMCLIESFEMIAAG